MWYCAGKAWGSSVLSKAYETRLSRLYSMHGFTSLTSPPEDISCMAPTPRRYWMQPSIVHSVGHPCLVSQPPFYSVATLRAKQTSNPRPDHRDRQTRYLPGGPEPEMGLRNVEWVVVDEAGVLFGNTFTPIQMAVETDDGFLDRDLQESTRTLLADVAAARGQSIPHTSRLRRKPQPHLPRSNLHL